MQDLSLHFLDIIENSAKAGATRISILLIYDGSWLDFKITDNGPGFPSDPVINPADPFYTSRTERPVGLGLALLRESTAVTGGHLTARNQPQGGAEVAGSINMAHIDARPLGNFAETIILAVISWPRLDFEILTGAHGQIITVLDTELIKKELDGVSLQHPGPRQFMRQCLEDGFRDLHNWLEQLPGDFHSF